MKIRVVAALALAALCAFAQGAPKKKNLQDLGNVLYIGDSITHGFRAPSYRWAMHKILVDNGIAYKEIGIETGSHSQGVAPGTMYMGVPFQNVHAAMSSQRAYETSGRLHNSPRLDRTDIFDWLGQDPEYKGTRVLDSMPDTCFILLGTNDTLSDYGDGKGIAPNIATVQKNLLDKKDGDLTVIVEALKKANPKVYIRVLAIPAWTDTRSNTSAADYEAVVKNYNAALAKRFKKEYVDINVGLVDIACEDKPGKAVKAFLNARDGLHPTRQGDMIMAGLVARSMGIAGRSAGLPRKAAARFVQDAQSLMYAASAKDGVALSAGTLTVGAGKKLEVPWNKASEDEQGLAAELTPTLGDGAQNGWDKEKGLTFKIGNGVHSGVLKFSECYITWNGKDVLYPLDMSKKHEPIRIAWVTGNASQNVDRGFYVWLGDMLIGEGLPDVGDKYCGVLLENTTESKVTVTGLAADTESSAPNTKRVVAPSAQVGQTPGAKN